MSKLLYKKDVPESLSQALHTMEQSLTHYYSKERMAINTR